MWPIVAGETKSHPLYVEGFWPVRYGQAFCINIPQTLKNGGAPLRPLTRKSFTSVTADVAWDTVDGLEDIPVSQQPHLNRTLKKTVVRKNHWWRDSVFWCPLLELTRLWLSSNGDITIHILSEFWSEEVTTVLGLWCRQGKKMCPKILFRQL